MNCLEPGSNPALPHSVAYQIPDEDAKLGGLLTEIEIQSKKKQNRSDEIKAFQPLCPLAMNALSHRLPLFSTSEQQLL